MLAFQRQIGKYCVGLITSVDIYFKNHTKHANTLREQKAESVVFKLAVHMLTTMLPDSDMLLPRP